MDLHLLEYFLRIAELGSVNRAAHEFGISQPMLSRHIARLEHELGHSLFQRHRGGVQLTEVGMRLIAPARAVLDQASRLKAEIASEPDTRVSIGLVPTLQRLITVPLIAELKRLLPRVVLHIREGSSEQLHDHLLRGLVDLSLVALDDRLSSDFEVEELVEEPLILVRPRGAPPLGDFASKANIAELPVIGATRTHITRSAVEHALWKVGLQMRITIEANTLGLGVELVKSGMGQVILPACALYDNEDLAGLSYAPLAPVEEFRIRWVLARNLRRMHLPEVRRCAAIIREFVVSRVEDGSWPAGKLVAPARETAK